MVGMNRYWLVKLPGFTGWKVFVHMQQIAQALQPSVKDWFGLVAWNGRIVALLPSCHLIH
jgi:hypothetical protein